jgi:hypothetical protein
MASGDVFAIKLHCTFAGQQCRPGFYLVEGGGAADVNPVRGAATTVASALAGSFLAGFSADLTAEGVEAQDVQPATGRSYFHAFSAPVAGDVADDNPVPPQDSMLIRWLTDLKGGKGKFARRGRTYMPGIYSTGQVSGFLITDLQDALSAFASRLFDRFVTDGTEYQMFAVAFNPGTNPRTVLEINPITSFSVDNVVDIQRRRRPGRGI